MGLRVDPSSWIKEEKCRLLLGYLAKNPLVQQELMSREDNDLRLGLAYIKARDYLIKDSWAEKEGYQQIFRRLEEDGSALLGSWDDHIERFEFYRASMKESAHQAVDYG